MTETHYILRFFYDRNQMLPEPIGTFVLLIIKMCDRKERPEDGYVAFVRLGEKLTKL